MLKIRRGEPADLAAVAAIQQACPEAAQWDVRDYPAYDFTVAGTRDALAGFLIARRLSTEESEILNLAVDPRERRKGVARSLVSCFLAESPGDVYLEVRAANQVAREFYKSIGFQEISIRKDYYSQPPDAAIVMKFHSC